MVPAAAARVGHYPVLEDDHRSPVSAREAQSPVAEEGEEHEGQIDEKELHTAPAIRLSAGDNLTPVNGRDSPPPEGSGERIQETTRYSFRGRLAPPQAPP